MDGKAPIRALKKIGKFLGSSLVTGLLIAAPIYLAGLLLVKVAKTLSPMVRPLARLTPAWFPAERVISLAIVLFVCFLIGVTVRIPSGRKVWEKLQSSLFRKIPGYDLIRSFTQRLGGAAENEAWKPALAEIEEALVPAFIIEELDDGRFTVFVPSVPTPLSGALYILTADRVHPLDLGVTCVLKTVSHWGLGAKDLAAAMGRIPVPPSDAARDDERKVA